ncbi:GntG family PLP-dependent aldolase [Desulfovibrio sp.]|uniref:GntG family PLP-dependent aldolase n=1 Tax=Desulfovibrio sp. TaxID=885 RepID=UPI0025C6CCA1|nr:GntG family PLP-dependent aldolase [Desulfovibrio sp.]
MPVVDLRSDTLTVPTEAMRAAMREAEVGDDGRVDAEGRGGDPTVNRLEDHAAELLGKEAALFCPSGTMANLVALATWCDRGDAAALEPDLHVFRTEKSPFMEKFLGIQPVFYSRDAEGMPEVASFASACATSGIKLACVENSHNFGGGICVSLARQQALAAAARKAEIPVHMDGARLFNAAVALGVDAAHLAACADSVMFCLSKGLGAPFGSVLCGTREFIAKARQTRKLLGGGMRQAGIMAAAGLIALRTGIDRLAEDHENARHLGAALAAYGEFVLTPVQSNIVMLDISASGRSSDWFEQQLAPLGLLAKGMGKDHLRLTTYRGVGRLDMARAIEAFERFMEENRALWK